MITEIDRNVSKGTSRNPRQNDIYRSMHSTKQHDEKYKSSFLQKRELYKEFYSKTFPKISLLNYAKDQKESIVGEYLIGPLIQVPGKRELVV